MNKLHTNVNPVDAEQGVIAYYSRVVNCECKKLTNLIYRNGFGHKVISCSQECADAHAISSVYGKYQK